jgi:uncharacterized protein YecT (DUF1311 family)
MKKLFFTFAIICTSILTNAQSQFEMNASAEEDFKNADKELNITYKKLMSNLNE